MPQLSTLALLCLLSCLLWSGVVYAQTTTYASPTGVSGNSGTMNSPWDLVTATNNLSPGTTLILLAGEYTVASEITLSTPGTASQPITIQGNGQATLNGQGMTGQDILQLSLYTGLTSGNFDMHYVIDGVNFKNAPRAGLRLSWVNYVTVKNVESGPNGVWGIFTDFSNYLTIQNVDCHDSGTQHGIYISNTCGNELVENSKFHDNAGAGIHHNGDSSSGDGQDGYTRGRIVNTTIRNNLIYNNGASGGAGINLDGVSNSAIYNNVLYNNVAGGIVNFAIDGVQPGNNVIIHNTVHFSSSNGRYGIAIHDGSGGNTIGNNILITAAAGKFAIDLEGAGTGNTVDFNAVFVPGGTNQTFTIDGSTPLTPAQFAAAGYGSNTLILPDATSNFMDAANGDFSEASGAPTIHAGDLSFSQVNGQVVPDFKGFNRGQGNVDIGAYNFFDTSSDGNDGNDGNDGSGNSSGAGTLSSFLINYSN